MIDKITNLEDVEHFIKSLVQEKVNAHPDEDFNNYLNVETDEASYSSAEAETRNQLMKESFDVCEKAGVDIYDFMQDIYLTETGLDKFIPKSTDIL